MKDMADRHTSWREKLAQARLAANDTSPVVAVGPNEAVLDEAIWEPGAEGDPVLIWTEDCVYSPISIGLYCWLQPAPRNPTGNGPDDVGAQEVASFY